MIEGNQTTQTGNIDLYDRCVLFSLGCCGPHLPKKEHCLMPLKALNKDVQDHFSSLGIKAINQDCSHMTSQMKKD